MTAPDPATLAAAEAHVSAAIRARCAVVLVRYGVPDDGELVYAAEVHNDRVVSDADLAGALRQLADRIAARARPAQPL